MGDRIAVLEGGKLQQLGKPSEVYRRPKNAFVAGFIGMPEMNFLPAVAEPAGVKVGDSELPIRVADYTGALRLGIRPEWVKVESGGAGMDGAVELVENFGAHALVHVKLRAGDTVRALLPNERIPAMGAAVKVSWPAPETHAFAPDSGVALQVREVEI
jgi:multiple sugar transport system ATP-binding protein